MRATTVKSSPRAADAEACYAALVKAFRRNSRVTVPSAATQAANRFGASSLKVDGKIFAMLVRGSLVLKLPASRVRELIIAGQALPFDAGKGRPMKEWLTIKSVDEREWLSLAREALRFVSDRVDSMLRGQ